MTLILNKSQAEAVADAMTALNNVDGRIKATFGSATGESVRVFEDEKGKITVARVVRFRTVQTRSYKDQNAFMSAHGIN